jgi:hypothetical protein
LFSRHVLHPRLQAIKLLASLTYPLKMTKGLEYATSRHVPKPISHQHLTWHQAQQQVLQVLVEPKAEAPEPTAQERQSLLPSPKA